MEGNSGWLQLSTGERLYWQWITTFLLLPHLFRTIDQSLFRVVLLEEVSSQQPSDLFACRYWDKIICIWSSLDSTLNSVWETSRASSPNLWKEFYARRSVAKCTILASWLNVSSRGGITGWIQAVMNALLQKEVVFVVQKEPTGHCLDTSSLSNYHLVASSAENRQI